jgi:hypothetical protein
MAKLRTACATRLLALLLLALPAAVQAQFTFTTNNGAITITGYNGTVSTLVIPGTTNGYPVTSIETNAFADNFYLTSVTIPDSVTNIGYGAFALCTSLTTITVNALNPAYSSAAGVLFNLNQTTLIQYPIGNAATSYTISNSVTSIGDAAFANCASLTSVTIPASVTSIGEYAFDDCPNLTSVYFEGNAPAGDSSVFLFDNLEVYYLPGTMGWDTTFGGSPTVLWNPQVQTNNGSFGVQNNQFGFNIIGSSNLVIVVEACTNLANPTWLPLATNTLTGGSSHFSDPQWTNYPSRFYRFSSP